MDTDHLIKKWLSDELTDAERKTFEKREDTPFHKSIIDGAAAFRASHFSEMPDFDSFRKRIPVEDTTERQNDPRPQAKSNREHDDVTAVRQIDWFRPVLKVATVLVIGLGIYFLFFLDTMTEVQTLVAEKTTVELPDASRVTLNALSEVRYSEKHWDAKREITLKGEAFFDVAKGSRFEVVTPNGTVSVLGTEFNVKQRGTFLEVTCFEGTVRVVTDEKTQILQVGDNFRFYNGETVSGKHVQKAPQWTNNISNFQRIPFSGVLAELQRQYHITVVHDGVDVEQLFSGGFVHGNLEEALKAIGEPLGLKYEIIKPGKVRLSIRE